MDYGQLCVDTLPVLTDNYAYLVRQGPHALVIDPGEADPVLEALDRTGTVLTAIAITHHHADHCGGARALRTATGCPVYASARSRIPDACAVGHIRGIPFFARTVTALETPGHTLDHLCYSFPGDKTGVPGLLFTGDTLFSGGCGRPFEGTAAMLFASISTCAACAPETRVYGGHEYTIDNYRFASSIEPDNQPVINKLARARALRAAGQPTVPTTLAEELRLNPFLRTEDFALKKALGLPHAAPVEVFAELRRRKNLW